MAIRDTNLVRGSLMDFAKLLSLPDDDCEVLFVSSRTLYLMANFAVNEVNFISRYFTESFDGDLVRVVESDGPEVPEILEIANNFGLEVVPVTCDIVGALNAISAAIAGLQFAGCCPPSGENPPQPPAVEGEDPPPGYVEYDPMIDQRKCKLANMAVDDLVEVIDQLIINDVDAKVSLGIGAVTALWNLIIAALASGPIGWGLAGLGTVLGLIGWFMVNSLDLGALKTLIEAEREALVCALYDAPNNTNAFEEFKNVLDGAGADAVDLLFLDTLNILDGLTVLFFLPENEQGEIIAQRLDGYEVVTDCSSCGPVSLWQLIPEDNYLGVVRVGGGPIGIGTIDNEGGSFTLQAVLLETGFWGLGLEIIGTEWNIGNPCTHSGGSITRNSGPDTWNTLIGRGCSNCGEVVGDAQPNAGTGEMINRTTLWYQSTSFFDCNFTINSLPITCP